MTEAAQPLTLLAIFATLATICRVVQNATKRNYGKWGNPYAWFTPLWIVQCIILMLPIYDFGYPTSWSTIWFIAACHAALAAGICMAMILGPHRDTGYPVNARPHALVPALLIGCVAQALFSLDTLFGSGIQIADRFDTSGMASAREENFMTLQSAFLGPLLGPMIAFASLTIVCAPMYAYAYGARLSWARRIDLARLLFVTGVTFTVFDTIFVRIGRFPALLTIVVLLIAMFLGRRAGGRSSKRTVQSILLRPIWLSACALILLALLTTATYLQQQRANGLQANQQMHAAFEVTLKPDVRYTIANTEFSTFYLLQILYFTHSFNVLSVYVDTPSSELPRPMLGTYNFGQVYKVVGRAVPGYDPEFWQKGRADMFAVIERRGRLGNTWGTLLRDLAVDFGFLGAVAAMFIFGGFAQAVTDSFYRSKSYLDAAMLSLIRTIFLFSGFHSLLYISLIGWPFCICSVLWLGRAAFTRRVAQKSKSNFARDQIEAPDATGSNA